MSGNQSTLEPASEAARQIATLWWVLFAISAVVCAVVTLLVVVAAVRGSSRRGRVVPDPHARDPLAGKVLIFVAGIAVPAVVLTVLFGLTIGTIDSTATASPNEGRLRVNVIGRQWFWDVEYPDANVRTANELHIPVGVPVRVQVSTLDVIHSFWAPELNRKLDMIPGRRNAIILRADRTGVYRGQCAEFCGLQHAYMAFEVVVQEQAAFRRWLARQARPASPPSTAAERRGRDVFMRGACAFCHRIAGTAATGRVGPDLTHVGGRRTIAAATLPNTPADLREWIHDPQHVKPGNRMPATPLTDSDLENVVAYLESLR